MLKAAIGWESFSSTSTIYSAYSSLQTILTSTFAEGNYLGSKDDVPQVTAKRQSNVYKDPLLLRIGKNPLLAKELVNQHNALQKNFKISEYESAAGLAKSLMDEYPKIVLFDFLVLKHNYKAIQGMIKKYVHKADAQDNLREYSEKINQSHASLKRHYIKCVQLLYQAFLQHSEEVIPDLIRICAQALDDLNRAESYGLLGKKYIDTVEFICCEFGRYGKKIIQALIKKCTYALGAASDDIRKNTRNTAKTNDLLIKQYPESLKLLRREFLKNQWNTAAVKPLIKACAYALEAQDGALEPPQNIDEPIEKYSKKLMLLNLALWQNNDVTIPMLSKFCIDNYFINDYVYGFNAEDYADLIPEEIDKLKQMAAIKEQYQNDLYALKFLESKSYYESYHKMIPDLVEFNTDISGRSMLHIAAAKGDYKTVETLLSHEVEKGLLDKWKMTALHYAAKFGHYRVLQLLLEGSVCEEIDSLTINKETPLLLATESGHAAIVSLLANKGADISLKNASGMAPYDIAIANLKRDQFGHLLDSDHRDIADFLRRNKAKQLPQKVPEMEPQPSSFQSCAQSLYKSLQEWQAFIYKV